MPGFLWQEVLPVPAIFGCRREVILEILDRKDRYSVGNTYSHKRTINGHVKFELLGYSGLGT